MQKEAFLKKWGNETGNEIGATLQELKKEKERRLKSLGKNKGEQVKE